MGSNSSKNEPSDSRSPKQNGEAENTKEPEQDQPNLQQSNLSEQEQHRPQSISTDQNAPTPTRLRPLSAPIPSSPSAVSDQDKKGLSSSLKDTSETGNVNLDVIQKLVDDVQQTLAQNPRKSNESNTKEATKALESQEHADEIKDDVHEISNVKAKYDSDAPTEQDESKKKRTPRKRTRSVNLEVKDVMECARKFYEAKAAEIEAASSDTPTDSKTNDKNQAKSDKDDDDGEKSIEIFRSEEVKDSEESDAGATGELMTYEIICELKDLKKLNNGDHGFELEDSLQNEQLTQIQVVKEQQIHLEEQQLECFVEQSDVLKDEKIESLYSGIQEEGNETPQPELNSPKHNEKNPETTTGSEPGEQNQESQKNQEQSGHQIEENYSESKTEIVNDDQDTIHLEKSNEDEHNTERIAKNEHDNSGENQ